MKKLAIFLNSLCLIAAFIWVFRHGFSGMLLASAYGMALGTIIGEQKKAFHIITITLNSLYLLVGIIIFSMGLMGKLFMEDIGGLIFLLVAISLLIIVVPGINIRFALTQMKNG